MTYEQRPHAADASELTEVVRDVWRRVLQVPDITADSHFFELGGHSMLANRLISRVRKTLGTSVPAQSIFQYPRFADFVDQVLAASRDHGPAGLVASGATSAALSLQQQELMAVEEIMAPSPVNNACVVATVAAPVDPAVLRTTLARLLDRHPMLRTTIQKDTRGPTQRTAPTAPEPELAVVDLTDRAAAPADRSLRRRLLRAYLTPFDLAAGPPLRAQLFRRGPEDHLLALHLHHLMGDGRSMHILLEDLVDCYLATVDGVTPPDPPGWTYFDYVHWQERWAPELAARVRPRWRDAVRAIAADLPALDPAPAAGRTAGAPLGRLSARIPADDLRPARSWVAGEGGTDFTMVAAALAAAVGQLDGRSRVGVGTLLDNRERPEFEGVVGPFATSGLLAVDVTDGSTAGQVLTSVREQLDGARESAGLPLERLVRDPAEEFLVDPDSLVDVVVSVDHVGVPVHDRWPLTVLTDDGEPLVPTTAAAPRLSVFGYARPSGDLDLTVEFPDLPAHRSRAAAVLDRAGAVLTRMASRDAPAGRPVAGSRAA